MPTAKIRKRTSLGKDVLIGYSFLLVGRFDHNVAEICNCIWMLFIFIASFKKNVRPNVTSRGHQGIGVRSFDKRTVCKFNLFSIYFQCWKNQEKLRKLIVFYTNQILMQCSFVKPTSSGWTEKITGCPDFETISAFMATESISH